jgi:hypothetical protein
VTGLSPIPAARRTSPPAIAALVCGILAFCGLGPLAIAAIICGHKALRQIRRTGGEGDGLARAGLILGYLAMAMTALIILILFAGSHPMPGSAPGHPVPDLTHRP